MVNAELGGVHGHPLKLNECFWRQAEEEGVKCGQQMVNDRGTKAILFGFVTVGNQSIYSTVKGTKPIVAGVTANPADPDGEERVLPEREPDERARRPSARTRSGSSRR